jgi:hypothetical protein
MGLLVLVQRPCITKYSNFFVETVFHYVAQADFELVGLLPQPPRCWDYRYARATNAWLRYYDFKREIRKETFYFFKKQSSI